MTALHRQIRAMRTTDIVTEYQVYAPDIGAYELQATGTTHVVTTCADALSE